MPTASYGPLDEALDRLSAFGPTLSNGNFNHAPMVAETLCALGRPEAVLPWIERYQPRLVPREPAGAPIDALAWQPELGRRERFSAWRQFFAAALADAEWRVVLDLWARRLAPGVSAAATHGAIRVGHAVRGLTERDTPARRRELGDALASWAASYAELPTAAGTQPATAPGEAIRLVSVVPPERRRPGNIVAALARLDEFPDFAPAIGLATLDGDAADRLAELTELFARVYLANARDIGTTIAFIHGVTSLAALATIAPQVDETTTRSLLRYGWQAGCGLYACFGRGTAYAAAIAPGDDDPEGLVDRAVANGDEHVIKFAEACLGRRWPPSPAFAAAVAHALSTIAR
jgi:hypothetical protein